MNHESVDPRLIANLRKVIIENNDLINFINSIGTGIIRSNGVYQSLQKIKFRQSSQHDACVWSSEDYCCNTNIRICDLTPKHITRRSIYDSSHSCGNDTLKNYFKNIYNSNWTGQYNSKRLGINIDRNIKIKGYTLNFNDMRTVIKECLTTLRYDSVIDCLWEVYYVGDRNCVLAISAVGGILYIRRQTITKMLETNNDEAVQRCLKNLLKCFNFTLQKYENINIRTYTDETVKLVEEDAINKIINSDDYSRRFYSYTSSSNEDIPKKFLQEVKHHIDETVRSAIKGTVFGINDKYTYTQILEDILYKHKQLEKSIFDEGFAKGMRIGMKLEMIGWAPVTINFPDNSNSTDVWWMNDVNIVPSTFIWREERYEIPENQRKAKIIKLYINQNGIMRCQGTHPNVSGSRVCMGDLTIDFSKSVSEIQDALDRAKSLLDIINYDSAYSSADRDALLKCSTKIRSLSLNDECVDNTGRRIKKTQPKIKEVNFDEDEDEDEIDEIIAENNSEIPVTYNNEVVASVVNVTSPTEVTEVSNSYIEEEQISVPTYVVPSNVDVIENIRLVEESGERRPVVFYTSNGDTITANTSSINRVDTHELALGDSNLL